jgi:hypothetical protein
MNITHQISAFMTLTADTLNGGIEREGGVETHRAERSGTEDKGEAEKRGREAERHRGRDKYMRSIENTLEWVRTS